MKYSNYVTDAGTRRPIPDDETFAAFGFSPEEVTVVEWRPLCHGLLGRAWGQRQATT